jgi:hypothetical protein
MRATSWPGRWFWGVELHQRRHSRALCVLKTGNWLFLRVAACFGGCGAPPFVGGGRCSDRIEQGMYLAPKLWPGGQAV